MSEENIEELEKYARRELDQIAKSLGLKSIDYQNKRSVVEAILEVREEQREEEARFQELKKRMREDTVKGKIAGIKFTAKKMRQYADKILQEGVSKLKAGIAEMWKGVTDIQTSIQEQSKENTQAIANLREGVREMQEGIRAFQSSIKEQAKENKRAVAAVHSGIQEFQSLIQKQMTKNQDARAAMHSGVKEIQVGIKEVQTAIGNQTAESQTYIKNFYG